MDKKYQIFISSTYKDLVEERNKVRDVILSMYHFPIGMEMFNAADEEQWEIIKETIDSSDYYILIIGKRYGTVIQDGPDAGISYTEKEFKYAKSVGVPVLAFIKNDKAVTSDKMDLEPEKIEKLNKFLEIVKDKREVDWFGTVDELGTKVTLALYKQFGRKNRPGWIRSGKLDMEQTLNEILEQNQKIRTLEHENKELRDKIESKMPHLGIASNNHFDNFYGGPYSNAASLLSETLSKEWSVDIDGQKVHICTSSLLHTRYITVDDLCIVPAKAGKFTIRAAIICEEYTKLEEKDFAIEVVDSASFFN